MFDKIAAWLRNHGISVSEEDLDYLKMHTRQITFPKNTIIMPQGKPVERLFFLNNGIVRLYRTTRETDATIDFIADHDFASTMVYVLNEIPSPCALETMTETTALYWERKDILSMKRHTQYANELEKIMLERLLCWNQDREIDIISLTPEERYLKLLHNQPMIIRQIPLKYIASYLGIHQDSLSRIRKKLARRN